MLESQRFVNSYRVYSSSVLRCSVHLAIHVCLLLLRDGPPSTNAFSLGRTLHHIWFTILIKGCSSSEAATRRRCIASVARQSLASGHQRVAVAVSVLTALHYTVNERDSLCVLTASVSVTVAPSDSRLPSQLASIHLL